MSAPGTSVASSQKTSRLRGLRAGVLIALALGIFALPGTAAAAAPTVTQLATGYDNACALATSGTVTCWGWNDYGALGNGKTTSSATPVQVSGISTATQIDGSAYHYCALLANGTVKCWGRNEFGQLGDGTTTSRSTPITVPGITTAVEVRVGWLHTCARLSDGTVKCWGTNWDATLGDGTLTQRLAPVEVSGISGATQIALQSRTSCALISGGTVKCWGATSLGQIGTGTGGGLAMSPVAVPGVTTATKIDAGDSFGCAVLSNSNVSCWGDNGHSAVSGASGLTGVSDISLGAGYGCALMPSGAVKCWGENSYGALADGTRVDRNYQVSMTGVSTATQVAAGFYHTCILLADGSVKCTNQNGNYGVLSTIANVVDATAPSTPGTFTGVPSAYTQLTGATIGFTLGESGGTVECRLDTADWAACTSVSGTTGSHTVSGLATGSHSVGVRQTDTSGNVSATGTSSSWTVDTTAPDAPVLSGAPSSSTTKDFASIAFTGEANATFTCKLDDAASYTACGSSPKSITSLADGVHTLYVKQTDQAGNTSAAGSTSWTVAKYVKATQIDGGSNAICARMSDSTAKCWGHSGVFMGPPTSGGYTAYTSATTLPGLYGVSKVAVGNAHTCALKDSGAVICFGDDTRNGATGSWERNWYPWAPNTVIPSGAVDVAAGWEVSCAVLATGTVKCWGYNGHGQLGRGGGDVNYATPQTVSGITNAVKVSITKLSGTPTVCAVLADKTAKCWGANTDGNVGDGTQNIAWSPVAVSGLTNVEDISLNSLATCARLTSGGVSCWGQSGANALGDAGPPGVSRRLTPTTLTNVSGANSISAGGGSGNTCVTRTNGTVACWGDNGAGQLGTGTTWGWSGSSWSTYNSSMPYTIPGITDAIQTSVSDYGVICALLSSGNIKCWGGQTSASSGWGDPWPLLGDGRVCGNNSRTGSCNSLTPVTVANLVSLVDDVAPDAPVLSGVASFSNSTSASVSISAESGATLTCSLDGAAYSACTSPKSLTGLAAGSHTLSVKATDASRNVSDAGSLTWTVDLTAPVAPVLSGAPTGVAKTKSASIGFTGEANATFTCSVDGGSYSACGSSPKALTSLAEGAHSLAVKQTDQAGNASPVASASWTVRSVPVFSAKPASLVNSRSASFAFDASPDDTTSCSLDGGDATSCSASFSTSGLADGAHTLVVTQADSNGAADGSATASWTVDATAPAAPGLTGAPASLTNSKTASITFSGESGATFTCAVDGAVSYTACGASPKALSSLADGAHSLSVKATDAAGNVSSAATASWTIDTAAPAAPVLTGAPDSLTDETGASIGFSGEANASFTCSVDGGSYSACGSSPKVLSDLSAGLHSVAVKATDQAGNVSVAATVSWRVGLAPAAPSISGEPSGEVNTSGASITLSGEAGGSFVCSLDRATYTACSSPIVLTGLDQGNHTLRVRSSDSAGNLSDEAAVAEWRVNTQVPDAPFVQGTQNGFTSATSAHVEATGDEDTVLWCSVDGGDFAVCDLPLDFTGLADGAHSVRVKQANRAGTESAVSTVSWIVDTVAPAAPGASGAPSGWVNTTSATVAFTGSEGNLTFKCAVDAGSFVACGSSKALTGLEDGAHSVAVKAVDQAGNESSVVTKSWNVDTVAPESPIVSGNRSGFTKLKTATVTFSGDTDPASTVVCSVDGGSYSAGACGSSPRAFSNLSDGAHGFSAKQVDLAGNESDVENVSWIVDTQAPAAPGLTSNRSGVTNLRTGLVGFTGEDNAKFECRVNTSSWVACSTSKAVSNLSDGTATVSVRQTDRAGNVSPVATKSWTVATLTVSSQSVLSVNGTANVGVGTEVTASAYAFSGSSGVQSLVKSWKRCGSSSTSSCSIISGADSDSYTATVSDFGKRLMFSVTHTSTDGAVATETSSMTGVVVPVATSTPVITIPDALSVPAYGRRLGVTGPTWRGLPDATPLLYQWQRCSANSTGCSNLAGQTKSSYTVTESSVGRRLRLMVGVDAGPVTVWVPTAISGVVNVVAKNTALPSLSYTTGLSAPKRGKDVSVRDGSWSFTLNGDFTYQWQACDTTTTSSCTDISGETDNRYTPTALIVGKRLRVLVTYTSPTGDVLTAATAVSGVAVK